MKARFSILTTPSKKYPFKTQARITLAYCVLRNFIMTLYLVNDNLYHYQQHCFVNINGIATDDEAMHEPENLLLIQIPYMLE